MKKIRLDGQLVNLPQGWADVTLKNFIELSKGKTKSEAIRILLGIEQGAKVAGLELIYREFSFLDKEPAIDKQPTKLGEYIFPQDITFETIEQFEDVKAEIQRVAAIEDLQEQTKSLAFYAAVYVQPLWDAGKYESSRAQEVAKRLLEYPCLEVMAAGSFFQAKCLSMESGLSMNYLRRNTLLRRRLPVFGRLMRRLGFMLHLIPSRGI